MIGLGGTKANTAVVVDTFSCDRKIKTIITVSIIVVIAAVIFVLVVLMVVLILLLLME